MARSERPSMKSLSLERLQMVIGFCSVMLLALARFQQTLQLADLQLAEIAAVKDSNVRSTIYNIRQFAITSNKLTYALLIGGLALALLCAWWISLSIRRPVNRLREAVDALAAGQLNSVIPHTDYQNETGDLARAVAKLQIGSQQLDMQRWIKSQEAAIQDELQQATTLSETGQRLLAQVAPLVHAGQGALYLADESGTTLSLTGSYAIDSAHPPAPEVAVGSGLVGQCALDRQPRRLNELPADYGRINSQLGQAQPRHLQVLPLLHGERLMGVLELASFDAPDEAGLALLDELLPKLAMSLEIKARNQAVHNMAAELEAQQVVLKATEAWYRGIIEAAPDGMLVVDAHGLILMTNPQLDKLFGYDEERLPGQYEPRNPHADERHHRHEPSGAEDRPGQKAAQLHREDPARRRAPAGHHQRHPRFLQDRGRQAGVEQVPFDLEDVLDTCPA
jgi:PAS domain-containing protein